MENYSAFQVNAALDGSVPSALAQTSPYAVGQESANQSRKDNVKQRLRSLDAFRGYDLTANGWLRYLAEFSAHYRIHEFVVYLGRRTID